MEIWVCLCVLCASYAYVHYVLASLMYLRIFVPLPFTRLPFFRCLRCPHFFTCLMCLSFLPALRVFLFYVPYVSPSFTSCVTYIHIFTCLACPHFLRALRAFIILLALGAFIFLRAYVLFMAMLIKLTQINEHLSPFIKYFHFYKARVIFLFKY